MKILWVSNAAWTKTGYGRATHAVTQQLLRAGHEVEVLAYWGLQGGQIEADGVLHHPPSSTDMWSNDVIPAYFEMTKADIVLIHRDIWVNAPNLGANIPLACWFPIDQTPLGVNSEAPLADTRWPITMSRFGQRVAKKAGFAVDYIPHSFDPTVYYEGRAYEERLGRLNVPQDAFLITIVAANKGFPSRKAWPEQLEACASFMRRHDDAWLYLHTNVTASQGGPNLNRLLELYNAPMERVALLHPFMDIFGLEDEDMGVLYRMSDVLLNASLAEGFGIPILEAQACGTPVITTNFSSMPEITWAGSAVDGQAVVNANYGFWMSPDPLSIRQALEQEYQLKGDAARTHRVAEALRAEWTHDAVFEAYWKPWLAKVEADLAMLRGSRG